MKFKIFFICMFVVLFSSYSFADEISHRAAAEELIILTNPDAMMKQLWEQVDDMMEQQFQQLGASEELRPVFKNYTDKIFELIRDELSFKNMKADMIESYVNTYTEKEILAISDFYKSPAGQAFLAKMPKLIQETMATTQKKMQPLMQKIQNISKEMESEIKKLKEQQER